MMPVRNYKANYDDMLPTTLRSFGRLLDDLSGSPTGRGMPVDLHREGDEWVFEAEVPGLRQEDINVTVENNILTIAGEYEQSEHQEGKTYHIRERRTGSFSRSFQLPSEADGDSVKATLTNGVLTVRVSTREDAKPRRIEVK